MLQAKFTAVKAPIDVLINDWTSRDTDALKAEKGLQMLTHGAGTRICMAAAGSAVWSTPGHHPEAE